MYVMVAVQHTVTAEGAQDVAWQKRLEPRVWDFGF